MVQKSSTVFNFRKTSPVQIHNLIVKSANGKATGLDLVSDRLLKIASPAISSQLAVIFNQCIEQGIFPDDLKIGRVVPVFKSGKKEDPGNYQQSLKDCSISNCTNILQTIICEVINIGAFDQFTLQYMPYKNLSAIGY